MSLQDPVLRLTTQLLLCEKRILVATVAYCEQKLQALQPSKEYANVTGGARVDSLLVLGHNSCCNLFCMFCDWTVNTFYMN